MIIKSFVDSLVHREVLGAAAFLAIPDEIGGAPVSGSSNLTAVQGFKVQCSRSDSLYLHKIKGSSKGSNRSRGSSRSSASLGSMRGQCLG
jgi:hypothetical protein